MSSVLKAIQQMVADRLNADAYFVGPPAIPVITENIGDIETAIQQAIAQLGVCAIVVTPTANAAFPNCFKPYFNDIKIVVRIVENVILNRGPSGIQKPASDVAEVVAALLHQYEPVGISESIFLETPSITIAPTGGVGRLLSYDVRLRTAGGFDMAVNKAATPIITYPGGFLVLSCATPGAGVFYTLDGSGPTPGNPGVHVWNGSGVGVTTGQKVRAQAWLAGLLVSAEATSTVP